MALKPTYEELEKKALEHKRSEEALKDSEEKYRLITENSLSGIFIIQTGIIKYANPRFAQMVGYELKEIVGQEALRFLSPEDRQWVDEQARRRLRGEIAPSIMEMRLVNKNGDIFWVEAIYSLCQYDDGPAMIVNVVDITERYQAEEALRESEEKYRLITENSWSGIVIIQRGIIKYTNPRYCEMVGYTCEEVIGQKALNFVHPDDQEWVDDMARRQLKGENILPVQEMRLVKKNGEIIWISTIHSLGKYQNRTALIVNNIDITDHKLSDEALKESEEKYRLITENSWSGIAIIQRGIIKYANPRYCEMVGYTCEEVIGQKAVNLVHPDDQKWVDELARRRLRGENAPSIMELRLVKKNGEHTWINTIHSLGKYQNRIALIVNDIDITDRKRAEEVLKESEEKYRSITENSWSGIIIIQKGIVDYANPRFAEIVGFELEEIIGQKGLELVYPDDREWVDDLARRRLQGEDVPPLMDIRLVKKNGETIWVKAIYSLGKFWDKTALITNLVDISDRKRAEEQLRKAKLELEVKSGNLEELNAALRVLLKSKDEGKKEIEENIYSNFQKLVMPYVEKLKKSSLRGRQTAYVQILESNLAEIVSPFLRQLASKHLNFTPKEIHVVGLVKEGKTSKEIAELLDMSRRAVEFHRNNIRKKLGLKDRKSNLRSHLLSLY